MSRPAADAVAIVTGATKGIGRAIAHALAGAGMNIVVTSRRQQDAERAAHVLESGGVGAIGVEFNIERRDGFSALLEAALGRFGRLDILVNNALSSSCLAPVDTLDDEQVESALTSNLCNTFLLSRLAQPYLKRSRGQVINIGSAVANRHLIGLPLYGIVKGALVQMTRVLAAEWAAHGIRVNAVNPGFVRTSAFSELGMSEERVNSSYEFYRGYHPLGRIGEPDDVAQLVAYLASDAANLISGAVIDVDGGYSVRGLPLYSA